MAVIDKERSLHISYPHAKLVPTILFMQAKKRPLILRCAISDKQKEQLIHNLKHDVVGKSYDYKRVIHYFVFSKLSEFKLLNRYADRDDRVVCSHHLLKQVLKVNAPLRFAISEFQIQECQDFEASSRQVPAT